MNKNKVIIGIDQSYKCTGIAVYVYNSETKKGRFWHTYAITPNECTKARKRRAIAANVEDLLRAIRFRFDDVRICFERPRLFSKGHISASFLLSIGALNGTIIDTAESRDVPCYSIDTRAWRRAAVGHCKRKENHKGIPPEKYFTVKHFCKIGYKRRIIRRAVDGSKLFEHDIADAMGIAVAAARLEGSALLRPET